MTKPKERVAIIDCDPLIHTIAHVQYSKGNINREEAVIGHVTDFLHSIISAVDSTRYIMFFQGPGFKNYRNTILPEYKSHRTTQDALVVWKKVICDQLIKMGANSLSTIESDDALYLYAEKCRAEGVDYLIVENDKDLAIVPGAHYNPYKRNLTQEERWYRFTPYMSTMSLWCQTLAGDPTDMPNALCGIPGVGLIIAKKKLKDVSLALLPYKTLQEYIKKFGISEGMRRMYLTYSMVNIVGPIGGNEETKKVLELKPIEYRDPTEGLFENTKDNLW